jgi:hypothetical protein
VIIGVTIDTVETWTWTDAGHVMTVPFHSIRQLHQPPPHALQERENPVMGSFNVQFNVRNLMAFYSPIGPGIKHLSIKRATVMADSKCPISYSIILAWIIN